MLNLRGICTKLEFKSILYLKGFQSSDIVNIIRMKSYFSITYKREGVFVCTTSVDFDDIYDCISNHSKSLLKCVQ